MSTAFKTDQYELTMLQSALTDGLAHKPAVFELFGRKIPQGRKYGVVGGIGRAIEAVKNFTFTDAQIAFLRAHNIVNEETLTYLSNYRFTGTIYAYREGELYFPHSPIMRVEGTFGECVLLETVLLSILNHDSAVASAASRMVQAAQGIPLAEMGSRRTHDDAATASARVSYITGFSATSNLEAGFTYGIPTMGTSAHAFTLAHKDEKTSFKQQVEALGEDTTLLVDTYNIEQGIRNAVEVAGERLGGVRIDSGDLYEETLNARKLLDSLGAQDAKITLSSDIDEFVISELVERGTPVDSIGAGTKVVTGSGHPTAGMVYKLVAIEDDNGSFRSVSKTASGKKSIGGRKWAWRMTDTQGMATKEVVYVRNNTYEEQYVPTPTMRPLMKKHVENGEVVFFPTVEESRKHHREAMEELRPMDKSIQAGTPALTVEYN